MSRIDLHLPDRNEDNYKQVYENDNFDENKSSFGHELIAGGAAFAGFKAFEDHQRAEGSSYRPTFYHPTDTSRQACIPPVRKGAPRRLCRS
jgi:hypothetical protein